MYAPVIDALTHEGGVDVSRIPLSVCAEKVFPGVDTVKQFEAEDWYRYDFTDDSASYNARALFLPLRFCRHLFLSVLLQLPPRFLRHLSEQAGQTHDRIPFRKPSKTRWIL